MTGGPVPDGDEWMTSRFAHYQPLAEVIAEIENRSKVPHAREKKLREAHARAGYTIPGYVEDIASIAKRTGPYGERDFDIPLGDTLPAEHRPGHRRRPRRAATPCPAARLRAGRPTRAAGPPVSPPHHTRHLAIVR